MLTDLAALTPPLIMAVAFIAGVVALLRSEMAPRRRGQMTPPDGTGSPGDPHGEMTSPEYARMTGRPQNGDVKDSSDGNSGTGEAAGSGTQDLPDSVDDDVISSASEDHPPAVPRPDY